MGTAMNNGAVGLSPAALAKYPPIVPGYVPAVVGVSEDMARAITGHWSAWINFQNARGRKAALAAEEDEDMALIALTAAFPAGLADVQALVAHLEWYVAEEAQRYRGDRGGSDIPFAILQNLRTAFECELHRRGAVVSEAA